MAVNTIGVLGLMIIDNYPFLDAIYQTIFTLTTVGYQETHPLSYQGKMFIVLLILGGVAVWTYALGVTISVVISDDLLGKIRETFMENRVADLRNHFIIAGYTEITRQVIRMLRKRRIPYVVLEDTQERINMAEEDMISDILPFNPFLNDSYRRAGVTTARGIVSAFPEDADNITAVVSGKIMEDEIDRRLLIISVASHKEARTKLKKVGADVVILPNELVGQRISAMALHPPESEQSSFLDRVAFGEFLDLDIKEVSVKKHYPLAGCTIRESSVRDETGAHILGIQRRGRRRLLLMPNPDIRIRPGDRVLIMGTVAQLRNLPHYLHGHSQQRDQNDAEEKSSHSEQSV
ncbi:potassium channel family protein [Magnetococcales bacterium HHB-1]